MPPSADGAARPIAVGSAPPTATVAPGERLPRFDAVERALHWANATLITIVMATALALYFGPLSTIVGRRETIKTIHVYCGLALPVPFAIAFALGRRTQLRSDVRRLNRWIADDRRWFRTLGHDPTIRLGKFHPGQKVNAAYLAGAIPLMVVTGSIMRWFGPFPLSWRTGATFVHDWTSFGLFVLVTGHVMKALSEPEAMRGMLSGSVSSRWAAAKHPRWHDELVGPEAPGDE